MKTSTKEYSDGDKFEDNLLEYYKHPSDDKLNKLYEMDKWATTYHVSPERHNLLSWYDFDPNANLLEVGAGCGAITGLFCEKMSAVTAVELSPRRAEILKHRHSKHTNLKVIASNLDAIPGAEKFDYVTSIGVLEYSGRYIEAHNPFQEFLTLLRKSLKPRGKLILAIENKFGLKYWAGYGEDHIGRHFEGIEGYPNYSGVKTFSKLELEELLAKSGYSKTYFYYPLHDYKFATHIFNQDNYPKSIIELPLGIHTSKQFADKETVFNQHRVFAELVKNDQFEFFANSFLVIAQ